jgi:delta24-sterol reductase
VSAELKIIPLKPFVELTYIPFNNAKEMYKEFTRLSMQAENGPMFVEALAFSKNQSVLMVGEMTQVTDMRNGTAYNRYPPSSFDNVVLHFFFVLLCPTPQHCEPSQVFNLGKYYAPWFYKHVEGFLTKDKPIDGKPFKEYIPIRDYYHRHTRSLFWTAELIIPFGNHPLFRLVFGWMFPMKVGFLKLTQPEALKQFYEQTHLFQGKIVWQNNPNKKILLLLLLLSTAFFFHFLCTYRHFGSGF